MAPMSMHYAPGMTGHDLYGLITVCGLDSAHLYECRACMYAGNSFAAMEEHVADSYTKEKLLRVKAGMPGAGPGRGR